MNGSNRVALVTGASRNIGRAIAQRFGQAGYAVALFARDLTMLNETASLLRYTGAEVSIHPGDVTDDAAVEAFVQTAAELHGGIDVLVNNAGVMNEAPTQDVTPTLFRQTLDVNLTAYYTAARAAHPFLAQRRGVVVNIGSLFGALGVSRAIAYCASKAAVDGLTRALAAEWARDGVRCVCLAPGYVESDITRDALADPELGRRIRSRIPLRRVGTPVEVADFAAFVASPEASFMTGETIVLDGGQRILP